MHGSVSAQLKANFTFQQPICGTLTVQFTNTSQNATTFFWFFSPGFSSTPNPQKTFGSYGVYDVMLIASSITSKNDTIIKQVVISPPPSFNMSGNPQKICPGKTATISATNNSVYKYLWKPGSGLNDPTSSSVQARPWLPTRYILTVTDSTTGCSDTGSVFVDVAACKPPKADFVFTKPPCGTFITTLSNRSTNNDHCLWEFDLKGTGSKDTSTSLDTLITHDYFVPGSYTVRLIVFDTTGLYSDTMIQVVQVGNPIVAKLYTPDTTVCAGSSFMLRGSSSGQVKWRPAEGLSDTVGEMVTCIIPSAITYTMTASENGCNDTKMVTVSSKQIPVSTFYADSPCHEQPTKYRIVTNGSMSDMLYTLYFGDGDSIEDGLPLHNYKEAKDYQSRMKVSFFGCDTFVSRIAKVHINPISDHSYGPIEIFMDSPCIFTHNNSSGASNYVWDFGDGDISTAKEPMHTFTDTGSYTLMLKAENDKGCTDTSVSHVVVKAHLEYDVPNCFTPNRAGPTENETFHIWSNTTLNDFKFTVWNRWGDRVFESIDQNFVWDGSFRDEPSSAGLYIWRMYYRISTEKISHDEGLLHIVN